MCVKFSGTVVSRNPFLKPLVRPRRSLTGSGQAAAAHFVLMTVDVEVLRLLSSGKHQDNTAKFFKWGSLKQGLACLYRPAQCDTQIAKRKHNQQVFSHEDRRRDRVCSVVGLSTGSLRH